MKINYKRLIELIIIGILASGSARIINIKNSLYKKEQVSLSKDSINLLQKCPKVLLIGNHPRHYSLASVNISLFSGDA